MVGLLADLGAPVDVNELIEQSESDGRAVARPLIARELVKAGHVRSEQEAFDRWLGDGRPAYVPRQGASPADVVRLISRAGGVSALAHPGLLGRDELIPSLAKAGLVALEVYHSEHDAGRQAHYAKLAKQHGLAACGGSDYHGEDHHRAKFLGKVGLPREEFMVVLQRLLLAHSGDSWAGVGLRPPPSSCIGSRAYIWFLDHSRALSIWRWGRAVIPRCLPKPTFARSASTVTTAESGGLAQSCGR